MFEEHGTFGVLADASAFSGLLILVSTLLACRQDVVLWVENSILAEAIEAAKPSIVP